jgi:repressor LexA
MLTSQQQQLLEFLQNRMEKDGVCPSFDEMREALDLKSKSGIHRLVTALEERGFIRRLENRARAIEIRKLPIAAVAPKVQLKTAPQGMVNLPLCGRIAAGLPIEALNNPRDEVSVPANLIGKGDHYALEVAGDSMVEAGILDGDTVLIRHAQQADNGQIVVALVDGETATLKRFIKQGRQIVLESANSNYAAQVYDAKRVQVQGRLVGLLRQY